jgi:hypothetical protein
MPVRRRRDGLIFDGLIFKEIGMRDVDNHEVVLPYNELRLIRCGGPCDG